MSQRNVVNPAVKHIMDNFNIFGFGNEEAALLQSIKELLENSIDSCKAAQSVTNPVKRSTNITISASNNCNSTIEMDVSDEGCGIEDPTTVLRCFQSSKDPNLQSTTLSTGRFGVGLSTCLVYSLLKIGTPMRLITKCKDSLGATVADYSMDQSGNPSCVQNRSVNTNGFISGTKIRVELPVSQNQETVVKRGGCQRNAFYAFNISLTRACPLYFNGSHASCRDVHDPIRCAPHNIYHHW